MRGDVPMLSLLRRALRGLDGLTWARSRLTRPCPEVGRSNRDVLLRPPSDCSRPELNCCTPVEVPLRADRLCPFCTWLATAAAARRLAAMAARPFCTRFARAASRTSSTEGRDGVAGVDAGSGGSGAMNWLEEPAVDSAAEGDSDRSDSAGVPTGGMLLVPRDARISPGSAVRRLAARAARPKRRFCSELSGAEATESRFRSWIERPEVFSRALAVSSIYLRHR